MTTMSEAMPSGIDEVSCVEDDCTVSARLVVMVVGKEGGKERRAASNQFGADSAAFSPPLHARCLTRLHLLVICSIFLHLFNVLMCMRVCPAFESILPCLNERTRCFAS